MSARKFSSKAIFEKVFILEDIESVPLNMLETQEYMHKHRMQKRGDKEKPVKEKVHIKMHNVTCHLRDCVSSGGAPTPAGTSIFMHMKCSCTQEV